MTETRTVAGAWSDGFRIWSEEITVRITHDAIGATLSLSDEKGLMLLIPLEAIADLVEVKL